MTFLQEAQKNQLNITLRELMPKGVEYITEDIDSELYTKLVLLNPTNSTHLGKKFNDYKKLNNKTLDSFVNRLKNELDVKEVYFFKTFNSKKRDVLNLYSKFKNSSSYCLALYCSDNLKDSLYKSIRNALAHGNIGKYKNGYFLYSVSSNSKIMNEMDKTISFYLRVKSLDKLNAYINVLKEYI